MPERVMMMTEDDNIGPLQPASTSPSMSDTTGSQLSHRQGPNWLPSPAFLLRGRDNSRD